jgi:YVTN family beta-propeller protein
LAIAYQFSPIIFPSNVFAVQFALTTIKSEYGTPTDTAYDPVNERIYVTNSGSDSVSIIDTNTNTLIGSPKVGISPTGIAYDPVNQRMYVANFGSRSVSLIDTRSMQAGISIQVGSGPQDIAYDPINGRMYVTLLDNKSISAIDTRSNTLVNQSIKVDFNPQAIAYDESNQKMYVTNSENNGTISAIDTKSNTLVGAPIEVGLIPQRIAYDPVNERMYVTNSGSDTVSVIEGDAPRNIGSLYIDSPFGITYDPRNQRMYVSSTNNNDIHVIETSTNTVMQKPISVGGSSRDLAYDPANDRLYVPNGDISTISVVQLFSLDTTITSSRDGLGHDVMNGSFSESDTINFSFKPSHTYIKENIYECSLDSSEFATCESPQIFGNLERGYSHIFEVRTIDKYGNKGQSNRFIWQVHMPERHDNGEGVSNTIYRNSMETKSNDLEAFECGFKSDTKPESNLHDRKEGLCNYDERDGKRQMEEEMISQSSVKPYDPITNSSSNNLAIPLPF